MKSDKEKYLEYRKLINSKKVFQYETFMVIGAIIAFFALTNVIGLTSINSDLFWALAGMGLVIQGFLERHKWRETKKNMLTADKFIFKGRKKY